MNVIRLLKKLLTPLGNNVYPGDLFYGNRKVGYVIRKIRTKSNEYYFCIKWNSMMEQSVDEYSGLEIKEKIESGEWRHHPVVIEKTAIGKWATS